VDNGTRNCSIYGNTLANNEGNGLQVYGGGNTTTWTDTGGHSITSNKLSSNCTFSVMDRRRAGKTLSTFQAHISLTYVYGTPTVVSKNSFTGSTPMKVYTNETDKYVTVQA
jgi:hypothetical protein